MGEKCTTWTLWRIWTGIGLQSFGGGASTQLLIRRAFVEKHEWLASEELGDFWSLCQFTPGINLIALTVLIGRRLGGTSGIVASLLGMLVPSATVTCALAVGFQAIRHSANVHTVLRGVVPATAGIMGFVAVGYARPLLEQARANGIRAVAVSIVFITVSALAIIVVKLSVMFVIVRVALIGALVFTPWRGAPTGRTPTGSMPERSSS